MKIPSEVKIGPFDYEIEFEDNLDCLGETFCDELLIKLRDGLPKATTEETFIHELMHAINHVYMNRGLEEGEIRQMSIGIYQVFKDNDFLKK